MNATGMRRSAIRSTLVLAVLLIASCQDHDSLGQDLVGSGSVAARVVRGAGLDSATYASVDTVVVRLVADGYDQEQRKPFSDHGCVFHGVPLGTTYAMGFSGLRDGSVVWSGTASGIVSASGTVGQVDSATVTVSVATDTSTALNSLSLDNGTIAPAFHPDTLAYVDTVGPEVASIAFSPTVTGTGLRAVEVAGTTVASGGSFPVVLSGDTLVEVKVTNVRTSATRTYRVQIRRKAASTPVPADSSASLATVQVDSRALVVDSATTTYVDSVAASATTAQVSATAFATGAVVTVNGGTSAVAGATADLDLSIDSVAEIVVENGSRRKTYLVNLRHKALPPDSSAALTSLELGGAAVSGFDSSQTSLTCTVGSGATTLLVEASPAAKGATVTIDGASGTRAEVAVATDRSVEIVVENGSRKRTYTVAVTHAPLPADSSAALSALYLDSKDLDGFDSSTLTYSVTVAAGTETATVKAVAAAQGASVAIDGTSGQGAVDLALDLAKDSVASIVVVNGSRTCTYTLEIRRSPVPIDSSAALSGLSVDGVDLAVDSSTAVYVDSVDFTASTVTVLAQALQPSATVTIRGSSVIHKIGTGSATAAGIDRLVDSVLTIRIENGSRGRDYTLKLPRRTTITDSRDGQIYRVVRIGGKVWFAENLRYAGSSTVGICYDELASNCATYGRLYTWAEALSTAYGNADLCPSGWRVPTKPQWDSLFQNVGSSTARLALGQAGTKWGGTDASTDDFGFGLLPAGFYNLASDKYSSLGSYAYLWSSTPGSLANTYWAPEFGNALSVNETVYASTGVAYSVRCVQE